MSSTAKDLVDEVAGKGNHRSEFHEATGEIKSRLDDLSEDIRGLAHSTKNASTAAVGVAKETALQQADVAKQKGAEWMEQLEGTIRSRPLTSVAVALGAGYLLSWILRK